MNCALCLVIFVMFTSVFAQEEETIEDYICSQKFKGCRLNYGTRSCQEEEASGCTSPFPYENMSECMQDFLGKGNICELYKPCENDGICSPITTTENKRTFKCECSDTGFFGHRCEIKCPLSLEARDPRTFPCITI